MPAEKDEKFPSRNTLAGISTYQLMSMSNDCKTRARENLHRASARQQHAPGFNLNIVPLRQQYPTRTEGKLLKKHRTSELSVCVCVTAVGRFEQARRRTPSKAGIHPRTQHTGPHLWQLERVLNHVCRTVYRHREWKLKALILRVSRFINPSHNTANTYRSINSCYGDRERRGSW